MYFKIIRQKITMLLITFKYNFVINNDAGAGFATFILFIQQSCADNTMACIPVVVCYLLLGRLLSMMLMRFFLRYFLKFIEQIVTKQIKF